MLPKKKSPMVLIDTSSWVHYLRPVGQADVRHRVSNLLTSGMAAWCPVVRLELWNGVIGGHEKKALHKMAELIPDLPIEPEVWEMANRIAEKGRASGVTAPAMDLTIAACARYHGAQLEHCDKHFDAIAKLDI